METMGTKSVGAFFCAMLLSSSTWAASLQPGQGTLFINQGQGFQPVNTRIDANAGDSVMVSPNGNATVTYGDGCSANVAPGSVTTIGEISPCAAGSSALEDPTAGTPCVDPNQIIGDMICVAALGAIGGGVWAALKTGNTNLIPASP